MIKTKVKCKASDPKAAIASIPSSGAKLLQQQQRPQANYNLNQPYMAQAQQVICVFARENLITQMQYQHSYPGANSPYSNNNFNNTNNNYNNFNNSPNINNVSIYHNNPFTATQTHQFQNHASFDPFAANQNNNWNQQNSQQNPQQQNNNNNFFF